MLSNQTEQALPTANLFIEFLNEDIALFYLARLNEITESDVLADKLKESATSGAMEILLSKLIKGVQRQSEVIKAGIQEERYE